MSNPSIPLGLPAAQVRGVSSADIVNAVEQTSNGDTLIAFGEVGILSSGSLSRIRVQGTVRLTAPEREELIARLMEHRFGDMTADLSGGAQ